MVAQTQTVQAHVVRTAMIGGGTSYDVYLPVEAKQYQPISFGCYATTIIWNGKRYYRLDDFLRTPAIDNLPALTDERWDTFQRLRVVAERLEAKIAALAFPELEGCKKLPGLWAGWSLPSDEVVVDVQLKPRD